MFASWRVGIILSAMNLTGPGFSSLIRHADEANLKIQKLNDSMQYLKMGAAFALGEVGRIGVSSFVAMANEAGKFQLTMNLVAQQTGATVDQMNKLNTLAVDLSAGKKRTMFSLTDVANMARELQQSGISMGNIVNTWSDGRSLLQEVAYAAEVENLRNGTSGVATARALGAIIKGYGLDTPENKSQLAGFVNTFTQVASQTHMKATDLATLETQFGQTARVFHMDPRSMLEMYGFLRQRGFQSSTAATSLSNMMINMLPNFSLNATKTAAKTQALMLLDALEKGAPGNAQKMLNMYLQKSSALGIPVDLHHMTAKQQNALAQAVVVATTTGKFGGHGTLYADQIVTSLHNAMLGFEHTFGKQTGDEIFATMSRQAVNLRGFRALMALAMNYDQWQDFRHKDQEQMNLDTRAQELRNTLEGLKKSIPNQISTILTLMGGMRPVSKIDPLTGKAITEYAPIDGGPADMAMKFLKALVSNLEKLSAWMKSHQRLAAEIGTLIGVLGVAGFVGAAILATSATMELTRALLIYTGAAEQGGLRGLFSRLLGVGGTATAVEEAATGGKALFWGGPGAVRRAFWQEKMAPMFKWTGKIGGADHPWNPFFMREVGQEMRHLPGGDAEWVVNRRNWFQQKAFNSRALWSGLMEGTDFAAFGRPFVALATRMAEFAPRLVVVGLTIGKIAVGLVDVVGWIWLAFSALDFVVKHAWDVGYWAGIFTNIINAVNHVIAQGVFDMVRGIWNLLKELFHLITHPADIAAGWSTFWSQFRDGFLKATDPKEWEKEHKAAAAREAAQRRSEYNQLRHSPLTAVAQRKYQEIHDKRQLSVTLQMNGVNLVDPVQQEKLVQKTADEVMRIVERETFINKKSMGHKADPRLYSLDDYESGGTF